MNGQKWIGTAKYIAVAFGVSIGVLLVYFSVYSPDQDQQADTKEQVDKTEETTSGSEKNQANQDTYAEKESGFSEANRYVYRYRQKLHSITRPVSGSSQAANQKPYILKREMSGRFSWVIFKKTSSDVYSVCKLLETEVDYQRSGGFQNQVEKFKQAVTEKVHLVSDPKGRIKSFRFPEAAGMETKFFWKNLIGTLLPVIPADHGDTWQSQEQVGLGTLNTMYRVRKSGQRQMAKLIRTNQSLTPQNSSGKGLFFEGTLKGDELSGRTVMALSQEQIVTEADGQLSIESTIQNPYQSRLTYSLTTDFHLLRTEQLDSQQLNDEMFAGTQASSVSELFAESERDSDREDREEQERKARNTFLTTLQELNQRSRTEELSGNQKAQYFSSLTEILEKNPGLLESLSEDLSLTEYPSESRSVLLDAIASSGGEEARNFLGSLISEPPTTAIGRQALSATWNLETIGSPLVNSLEESLSTAQGSTPLYRTALRTAGIVQRNMEEGELKNRLLEALTDTESRHQSEEDYLAYLDGLGNSTHPKSHPEIIEVVQDTSSEKIKHYGLKTLGNHQIDAGTRFLHQFANQTQNVTLKQRALQSLLRHFRHTEELPDIEGIRNTFREQLYDARPRIRKTMLDYLKIKAQLGDQESLNELEKISKQEENEDVRARANRILDSINQ